MSLQLISFRFCIIFHSYQFSYLFLYIHNFSQEIKAFSFYKYARTSCSIDDQRKLSLKSMFMFMIAQSTQIINKSFEVFTLVCCNLKLRKVHLLFWIVHFIDGSKYWKKRLFFVEIFSDENLYLRMYFILNYNFNYLSLLTVICWKLDKMWNFTVLRTYRNYRLKSKNVL